MSEQPPGQGWTGDAGREAYRPSGQPSYGASPTGHSESAGGAGYPAGQHQQLPRADSKGFLSSLFDFGFTSFVTPKVVKVLYALIVIVVGLSALGFAVTMLATNVLFGIITLLIGAPLYFLVVTALYRITLEFFMVIFRMSEDIRALRERGDLR
ncbi:MAG TPA: DUF4282 domain-containing protein [Streptosporangiaceae bacterium]|nr:DUF4282 domain-containing protein [Streptosporangiaceae bacterium]